jgi:hypothetical protein
MRTTHYPISRPERWTWIAILRLLIIAALLAGMLAGCAEETDPVFEKQTFTSIFDHNGFSSAYYPVSLRQTPDGGYLILGERRIARSAFRGTYLLKADASGNFVADASLDQFANPIGELMEVGGSYYFFAMDTLSLGGLLIKTDETLADAEVAGQSHFTYPSAASQDGNTLLLLSYDHVEKKSVVAGYDINGQVVKGPSQFTIGAGDDVEEPIINHILRTGRRFPFLVGKVSEGLYFFNGFHNYSFSLVFTDLEEDAAGGVVHGQQDDGGFSAVVPIENNRFAASRFDFGEMYFLPGVDLQTSGPTVGAYLQGLALPELTPEASVKILRTEIGTRKVLVYASDTKSKQIGLFYYDEATGEFISSRYLGFSNPFEVADVIETEDGGIAVCGTTWLAGRFPRICLFKISKDQHEQQVE